MDDDLINEAEERAIEEEEFENGTFWRRQGKQQTKATFYKNAYFKLLEKVKWKNVHDERPTEDGWYMICDNLGNVIPAEYEKKTLTWWTAFGDEIKTVTHWKNYPDSPTW